MKVTSSCTTPTTPISAALCAPSIPDLAVAAQVQNTLAARNGRPEVQWDCEFSSGRLELARLDRDLSAEIGDGCVSTYGLFAAANSEDYGDFEAAILNGIKNHRTAKPSQVLSGTGSSSGCKRTGISAFIFVKTKSSDSHPETWRKQGTLAPSSSDVELATSQRSSEGVITEVLEV
ncbi:MAG: hypothetical protein M1829_001882 [Trizodia sp. TS-e1964]|nr:MAG: hypothetical protein M1829_001882 [Trizodia sp. TS-e1964]